MTPEERRQLISKLESIVVGARLLLSISRTRLLKEQKPDGSNCDFLVTSLALVDGTLANAEQRLQTIAKWEAE